MLLDCILSKEIPRQSPGLRERIRRNKAIIKDREFQSHFKKGKFKTEPNALALFLFGGNSTLVETLDEATGQMVQATQYDFTPVAIFWVVASVISFLLPVLNWKYRKQINPMQISALLRWRQASRLKKTA